MTLTAHKNVFRFGKYKLNHTDCVLQKKQNICPWKLNLVVFDSDIEQSMLQLIL